MPKKLCFYLGYIVSTDSHNLSAHHECTECKSTVSGKQVMEQDNSLKLELSKVNRYVKKLI